MCAHACCCRPHARAAGCATHPSHPPLALPTQPRHPPPPHNTRHPQTAYPEARKFIDAGEMITDAVVGDALLEALLADPSWAPQADASSSHSSGGGEAAGALGSHGGHERGGIVVDGFPRTAVQVDFLKLLYDRLAALHRAQPEAYPRPSFKVRTPHAWLLPRAVFARVEQLCSVCSAAGWQRTCWRKGSMKWTQTTHNSTRSHTPKVVMLYIDEQTSVGRQLARAAQTQARNRKMLDAGAGGALTAARATDVSGEKARKRYMVFRHHYSAILRLKQFFPVSTV